MCYEPIMTEKAVLRSRSSEDADDRREASERREANEAEPARGRLDGLLGYLLRRADVATFQSFNAHMAEDRVSPGQLGVLLLCEANAGINQTRLGKALGIDRSTLVAMIDLLEGRGLIARTPSAVDRRSHALKLTRQGDAFLKSLHPRLMRHESEIARNLSAAERRQLMDLLTRLAPP
jgi:DNA-binding MarR family transcriptional regulator